MLPVAGTGTKFATVASVTSKTFEQEPVRPAGVMVQLRPVTPVSVTRPLPVPAPTMLIAGAVNVAVMVTGPVIVQRAVTHVVSLIETFELPAAPGNSRIVAPNGY